MLFLLLGTLFIELCSSCDCGFTDLDPNDPYCYRIELEEKTFDEAKRACWNLGGRIIEIYTQQQNERIANHFKNVVDKSDSYEDGIWLGVKRTGKKPSLI